MNPSRSIELPSPGIERLHQEACDEGYDFIDTLVEEWASATNRFDGPGEILYGYVDQGLLVAVGGLTLDPFAGRPDMGRIRRVYVRSAWRNRGIGRALVAALVDHARSCFSCVRLRAENPLASRLYESMGFVPIASPDASHILLFDRAAA
jgi:GNAT superfamily N-acetyltransferase